MSASLKELARTIFHRTLDGIDIPATMQQKLSLEGSRLTLDGLTVDLGGYSRIVAVAMGKAAVASARGLVELLGPEVIVEGILVAPHELLRKSAAVPGFRAMRASHPLPDEGSLAAGRAILELLSSCDERTLIIFLLSGGSSALVECPLDPGLTLGDLRELYRVLVGCGATIDEINAIRKHLSAVKGGRLAAAAQRSMKISLGITDVPRGCESALASGPTLPDPTTVASACEIIERYALRPRLPAAIRAKFEHPDEIPETPKAGDAAFARSHFQLLLDMDDLFHHAHLAAQGCGCITLCDNCTDDWPIAEAADYLLKELARLRMENKGRPAVLIADGELRSPVIGEGVGGRNAAFVLHCVEKIVGKNIAVLSAGTDGLDGSSPAAGAVADGETLERARSLSLSPAEYFQRSDSYNFFRLLGDVIETGPTGNNLRDLRVLVAQ